MPTPFRRRFEPAALILLGAAILTGCSTPSDRLPVDNRRALCPLPALPSGHTPGDPAIVAALFAADGIRLTPEQTGGLLPAAAREGRMDRNALRRTAWEHRRIPLPVPADETGLWRELGNNHPLMILLPPGPENRSFTAHIPVAWNRTRGTLDLLNGDGTVRTLPDKAFFDRRVLLRHAALRLARPGDLHRRASDREELLPLADYWFHRGYLRRADAVYARLLAHHPDDLDALIGRGNVQVRRGRPSRAIPMYESALAMDPANPRILNNLAHARLLAGDDLPRAMELAGQALQLDPGNPLYLETAGSLHLRAGDADKAARLLERAWAQAGPQPPPVQTAILDQLIRAWMAAGRPDLARQVADHRRRAHPGIPLPRDIRKALARIP